jgi:hypothetical protein
MALQMNIPASYEKISCAFNIFIQSLPSASSLPGTLEGNKIHKSAETRQRPKMSSKFMSDQFLVHYEQTIWQADFKNNQNTHTEERNRLSASQFVFRADYSCYGMALGLAYAYDYYLHYYLVLY